MMLTRKAVARPGHGPRRAVALAAGLAGIALAITACSTPATVEPPKDTGGSQSPEGDGGTGAPEVESEFDGVYEQLEGLDADARTAKLIELANEEGGLSVYTSNTEMQAFADEFEEMYKEQGLKSRVSIYRAPANTVLARLLEEHQAGYRGADVVEVHSKEMAALTDNGIFTPFKSPVLDNRRDGLDFENWSISRMTAHTVTWNTDQVTGSDIPTSYEDLLKPQWSGKVMMEPRAFDWYVTLWKYFEAQGQSEEQIDTFFEDLAANSRTVEGFPLENEFLVTGEMPLAAGSYAHLAYKAAQDGAPISFEPFVEPVVIVPSGMGLVKSARAPAMAILFMEYYLTDAQDLLASQGRVPPRELEEGGMLGGAEFIVTDPAELEGDAGASWQQRYEDLLAGVAKLG